MARILDSDVNNMVYSGTTENRSKHMFSSFPDWEWKYLHENKIVYTETQSGTQTRSQMRKQKVNWTNTTLTTKGTVKIN